jgi:hypothetical protein
MINIAAADTFMAIFGYKRVTEICPYCDGGKDRKPGEKPRPLQCWRARKKKMVCPKGQEKR